MFTTHNKLRKQLIGYVDDILSGGHPTLRNLQTQNVEDINDWELLTERKGYIFELPPQGTAILNAIYNPSVILPTLPTIDISRGVLSNTKTDTKIEVTIRVYEGKLVRLYFRTSDGVPFPRSMRGWEYLPPKDIYSLPFFKEPDYSTLDHRFELWLLQNISQPPNGQPDFPLQSSVYPQAFGHFRRVFSFLRIGEVSFSTPDQCFDIDFGGKVYWNFASDFVGDPYCFLDGKDHVYHLLHDDPEGIEELGSFEEFIKMLVEEYTDWKGH